MDAKLLLAQIGTGVLMSCGARDFVRDVNQLMFRVGPKSKLAKVIITLNGRDTYDVRYVELSRKTYEPVVDEVEEDIYNDSLPAVVRRMGDR